MSSCNAPDPTGTEGEATARHRHHDDIPQNTARPLDLAALAGPADEALLTGQPVVVLEHGVILVPDIFVVEALANGLPPLPDTYRLQRDDGRALYVFRAPGGLR